MPPGGQKHQIREKDVLCPLQTSNILSLNFSRFLKDCCGKLVVNECFWAAKSVISTLRINVSKVMGVLSFSIYIYHNNRFIPDVSLHCQAGKDLLSLRDRSWLEKSPAKMGKTTDLLINSVVAIRYSTWHFPTQTSRWLFINFAIFWKYSNKSGWENLLE